MFQTSFKQEETIPAAKAGQVTVAGLIDSGENWGLTQLKEGERGVSRGGERFQKLVNREDTCVSAGAKQAMRGVSGGGLSTWRALPEGAAASSFSAVVSKPFLESARQ